MGPIVGTSYCRMVLATIHLLTLNRVSGGACVPNLQTPVPTPADGAPVCSGPQGHTGSSSPVLAACARQAHPLPGDSALGVLPFGSRTDSASLSVVWSDPSSAPAPCLPECRSGEPPTPPSSVPSQPTLHSVTRTTLTSKSHNP